MDAREPTGDGSVPRGLVPLAWLAVLVSFALGVAKLFAERADPPAWASSPHHLYDGFVSIDNYSARAEWVQHRLFGRELSETATLALAGDHLHETSWGGPFLVACLAAVLGSIPLAFVLVVVGCQAAAFSIGFGLARRACGAACGLAFVVLCAGHLTSLRTTAQLYLDWPVTACVLGVAALSTSFAVRPGLARFLALVAVACIGVTTKLSFAPALALPPLAWVLARGLRSLPVAAAIGIALVPLPLATAELVSRVGPDATGAAALVGDFEHLFGVWDLTPKRLAQWGVEMVLLVQVLPLALLPWRTLHTSGRFAALGCGVFFLATASLALPAIPRLYMPVMVLLTLAAAIGLARRRAWPTSLLALYLALNTALGVALLLR